MLLKLPNVPGRLPNIPRISVIRNGCKAMFSMPKKPPLEPKKPPSKLPSKLKLIQQSQN